MKCIGGNRGCSDVIPILAKYALKKQKDLGPDIFAKYAAFKEVPKTSNTTSSSGGTTSKSFGSNDMEEDREEGGGRGRGRGGRGKGGRGKGKGRGHWKNKKNTDENLRNLDPESTEFLGIEVQDPDGGQNPGVPVEEGVTYGVSVLTSDSANSVDEVEMTVDTNTINEGSIIPDGGENGEKIENSSVNLNTAMHINWQSEIDVGNRTDDVTATSDDVFQNEGRKENGKIRNEIEDNDLTRKRRKVGTLDLDSTLIKNTAHKEISQLQAQLQVEVEDESVDEEDQEDRMVQCNECSRWVHALCEGIDQSQYEAMTRGTHPVWVREPWILDSILY